MLPPDAMPRCPMCLWTLEWDEERRVYYCPSCSKDFRKPAAGGEGEI